MPWAQTLSDLSPYLSLHISACALVSACCSFLPSFCQHVSSGTEDSPTAPLCPLHISLSSCIHTKYTDVQIEGENIQLGSLLQRFMLPSSCYCHLLEPNNPVCSWTCTEVSALGAWTICTLSLLVSHHCGGAILEAIESDLIPTLAFCQQRLHSDKHNGSCGQTNLLLCASCGLIEYVHEGLELCFSCQKQVWITAGPATTPPSEVSYLHSLTIK